MENDALRPDEAAAALGLVQSSRAELADRLVTPWWYHPALGLLTGGLLLAVQLESIVLLVVALVLFGLGVGALVATYKQQNGVWVNGFHPGRARRWAVALGVLSPACILTATVLRHLFDSLWPAGVLALVVVASTVVLGRRYDSELRAELRASR